MFTSRVISVIPATSAICRKIPIRTKTDITKAARVYNKLLTGRKKGNSWYVPKPMKPMTPKSMVKIEDGGTYRRCRVLNNLFMQYITDIMASGDLAEIILGNGIEVSNVQMSSTYQRLDVYWLCTRLDLDEDDLEKKLLQLAGPMRRELTKLRVIGEVPPINFVRDQRRVGMNLLQRLYDEASYGDNYKPRGIEAMKIKEFEPQYRTTSLNGEGEEEDASIPAMRHDVFAVDYVLIMNRVKDSWMKTRKSQPKMEGYVEPTTISPSELTYVTLEMVQRAEAERTKNKEVLTDFLRVRQNERKLKWKIISREREPLPVFDDGSDDDDELWKNYEDVYKL